MENTKTFEARLARIMTAAKIEKEADLAKILEINQSSIAAARKRQQVPPAWVEKIAEKFNINANWLFFGQGEARLHQVQDSCFLAKDCDVELRLVPMAEARLSAGNGSLEVSANHERSYAFRMDFLLRKGNPDKMVLMRVAGDSMQPEILDGDVVLLDQGRKDIIPGRIFAVGFEEAIYLKRIDMVPGKVILKSVNEEAYPPIELDIRGDMAEYFRVIGKVVWSGREYR